MGLLDVVRAHRVAPDAALQKAWELHRQSGLGLAHVLVEAGVIGSQELAVLLAQAMPLPRYDPGRYTPEPDDVRRLPWVLTARRRVLVIGPRSGREGLYVAFTDPSDELARAAAEQALQAPIEPLLVDEDTFEYALRHYFGEGLSQRQLGAVPQGFTTPPLVVGEHLSLGDDDDFLTESTDEALQAMLPALVARQGGASVGDADVDWLMSKQTGAYPAGRERAGDTALDTTPPLSSAQLSELPGAPTQVMDVSPSAFEVAATNVDERPGRSPSPGRVELTGEGSSLSAPELTLEGEEGELTGPPTVVDERPPGGEGEQES